MKSKRLLVKVVLDGWGLSPVKEGNAVALAKTPVMDDLERHYPWAAIQAAETSVGLSFGEVGNSEVGHMNLGAGQVVWQSLPRISMAIDDKSFFKNEEFLAAIEHAKKHKSNLHFVGLASNGGVHAHIDHLHALLQLVKKEAGWRLKHRVFVHAFTDGRDTAPQVAVNFLTTLVEGMKTWHIGEVASLAGRSFAMDRNNNWDRTERAYKVMTGQSESKTNDLLKAIEDSYQKKVFDENIEPITMVNEKGEPVGPIKENDAVIFFNFRPDRARQLTRAFVSSDFDKFKRSKLKNLYFVTMTEYEEGLPVKIAFSPQHITEPLGKIVAKAGWQQLRIAETEKYAHVTYFYNGGVEDVFKNEERVVIPSPSVKSYDKQPEMSALKVTKRLIKEINSGKYDFILLNFANADMVGHTGNLKAAIKAVEAVDECLGKVVETVLVQKGILLVTADHGNAEIMIDPLTGKPHKEHTTSPVPLILVEPSLKREKTDDEILAMKTEISPIGILSDITLTALELTGLRPAKEMTSKSLLEYLK